jgi:hypothetical protein
LSEGWSKEADRERERVAGVEKRERERVIDESRSREQRESVAGERESMRERWESKVWENKDVKK